MTGQTEPYLGQAIGLAGVKQPSSQIEARHVFDRHTSLVYYGSRFASIKTCYL